MNTLKHPGFSRFLPALLSGIVACQIMAGCALFVTGAVVGAGVFTYAEGELKRSYQAPYEETVQASLSAMADLKIEVEKVQKQGLTTTINGKIDGKPVSAAISRIDVNISEVGIRSGYVGVWDKGFSMKVHENIAKRLR